MIMIISSNNNNGPIKLQQLQNQLGIPPEAVRNMRRSSLPKLRKPMRIRPNRGRPRQYKQADRPGRRAIYVCMYIYIYRERERDRER